MKMVLCFTLPLLLFFNPGSSHLAEEVYICSGSGSYAYHFYKDCKAFSKCTTNISPVSLKHAKAGLKRKPCGICMKRKNPAARRQAANL